LIDKAPSDKNSSQTLLTLFQVE